MFTLVSRGKGERGQGKNGGRLGDQGRRKPGKAKESKASCCVYKSEGAVSKELNQITTSPMSSFHNHCRESISLPPTEGSRVTPPRSKTRLHPPSLRSH